MTSRDRGAWLPWALAVAGGVLWALCFGTAPRPWLACVALVPLVTLLALPARGRFEPALWGLLHGVVHWLCAIPWLAATLATFGDLPTALGWLLVALLAAVLALWHALFVLLGRRLWRLGATASPALALVSLPALWVALAWLQGHAGVFAFPWNLAAYAWTDVPGALPLAAWVGAHGVSFLVVTVDVAVAHALLTRRVAPALATLMTVALVLTVAGRWSEAAQSPHRPGREVTVVQPDGTVLGDAVALELAYQRLIELTAKACRDPSPAADRLVVWPESAAYPMTFGRSPRLAADLARLTAGGCRILLNTPWASGNETYNAALLLAADRATGEAAVAGRYAKRRLVPWGEYVPLGDVLPFIGAVARIASPFSPGRDVALLPWGDDRIGVAICYEVIFPQTVAAQVRAGATLLVTVTNDAWYGDTAAPWQHFRAARFRAAENRRPLLRAALTGVSGLIDARGAVVRALGVGEVGRLDGAVRGGTELSPYARAPWLVPLVCALIALSGLAAFAIIARRRR